jgi:uncharacterized protein YcbX
MHVAEIWRYPIKSVGGEQLTEADVTSTGIRHDRGWGLVDDNTGNVLTARREPRLLMGAARIDSGEPVVVIDGNHELHTSGDFSEWLDRPVTLSAAAGQVGGTYEVPLDFENDDEWVSWQGPADAWHDSDRSRLSLLSTASLRDWDRRRFRSNVLLAGDNEDELVGHDVDLGSCRLNITQRINRCVIVTRPQPGLSRDLDVLRTINAERDNSLAVGALVVEPGRFAIGDPLLSS